MNKKNQSDLFRIWAFGDSHVGTDLRQGRESLAEAIRQSEFGGADGGPPFEWELAIDVGDMSGGQAVPQDDEGAEVVRQFNALKKHSREAIYSVCGNHDRGAPGENPPNAWWRKWVDPTGENRKFSKVNSAQRPYPVTGTWERYSFHVGNLLFLMMSDINEPTQTIGRGELGGNPAGVVSGETFRWWQRMVENNRDSLIVSVHHYMLKDTTVASGEWEGVRRNEKGEWINGYHGYKPQGAPKGASYLYFVDSQPDAQAFEQYLAAHPGAVALWLGGHTHTHPDDTAGGKSHIETRWGTHFINVAALTRHHVCLPSPPKSRLLTFTPGSQKLRVQCYMHTTHYAAQGWYPPAERILTLPRPFEPPK